MSQQKKPLKLKTMTTQYVDVTDRAERPYTDTGTEFHRAENASKKNQIYFQMIQQIDWFQVEPTL